MPILATIITAAVSGVVSWLFWDALKVRFEIKTFLRFIGFGIIALVFAANTFLNIDSTASQFRGSSLVIWLISVAMFTIFLSFALDEHFSLKLAVIVPILALLFLKNHWQISIQALLIAISVLQLSYSTKHRDLIPFGVGFVLIAIAEFFLGLEAQLQLAADFLYIFSQAALLYWWWSYIGIRFSINSLGPRLKV